MIAQVNVTPDLPGHDLVSVGLADLEHGRETVESLLLQTAGPRLRRLGLDIPSRPGGSASHRLFELLSASAGAHSRYNALVGRMVSFARAAERAAAG